MNNITLMYHGIADNFAEFGINETGAEIYCVKPAEFEKQMEYVGKIVSSTPCRCDELNNLHTSKVIITFDDGLESDYTQALPILKKFGLKAYFFILVEKIGTKGYLNWQQIKELKDAGMIIGAHGLTHRILTELNNSELERELGKSKNILEKNLQTQIECMSIPRGLYNAKVIKEAIKLGYKKIFTSNPFDNDDFHIGRIAIKSGMSFEYFKKIADNGLSGREKVKYIALGAVRKVLGNKVYDKIRTNLLKKP